MNSQAITAVILGVGVAILLGSILGLRFPMGRQSNNQISPTPTPTEGATIAPATAPATVPTISQNGTPFPSPYPTATPTATPVPQAPTTIDPSEQAPPVNALW